jgi:hypothetical protein
LIEIGRAIANNLLTVDRDHRLAAVRRNTLDRNRHTGMLCHHLVGKRFNSVLLMLPRLRRRRANEQAGFL